MILLRYFIRILCFFLFAFCAHSFSYYSDQEHKNESSDTDAIDPVPDLDAFTMHLHYPEVARRAGLEGPMMVRVLVDSNGRIQKHIYEVSLGPLFEKSVDEALKHITFSLARYKGKAATVPVTIPVNFKIHGVSTYNFNYHEQILYCLSNLMKLDADNISEYYYLRGREHFINREYDYANEDYNQYISIIKENQKPYYEDGILNLIANSLPKDTINLDSLIEKGKILQNHFLYQQALENYNIVINRDSNNILALQHRAHFFTKCELYENSIIDNLKLIELNHKDSIAYLNAGWNFYQLGKMNECIDFSEKAIQLSPKFYKAMYNQALAYLRLNQIDSCRALYKRTKKMQGDNVPDVRKAAITDLKKLVHDDIMKDESRSILKDIFDQTREDIVRSW
ncbi:MAG: TonB family protein [Ignavibacteriae bacterium]|nr:TonB family protein [Ignavibacteriota bacterium]